MKEPEISLEKIILREAVRLLADYAADRPEMTETQSAQLSSAKSLAQWPESREIQALQLVFDRVSLDSLQASTHYLPAIALNEKALSIPYPVTCPPSLENLKTEATKTLSTFSSADWQNAGLLLATLEKLGSHVSLGGGDISLYDLAKTTSAIASALAGNSATENLCLIAGDLSGIQDFIYTIASAGALKSLRARSFYLQLVTEEIVFRLLQALSLPRTSIIYAGGGNLYVLAPAGEKTSQAVQSVQSTINQWLRQDFQGKVFLALTARDFPAQDVQGIAFSAQWEKAIQKLAQQKNRKFSDQLTSLFSAKAAFENCKVCHRDDVSTLKPLNRHEESSALACSSCRHLFELGGKLPKAKAIVRSSQKKLLRSQYALPFHFSRDEIIYYHCFETPQNVPNHSPTWLINSWDLNKYRQPEVRSLFMGDYYAPSSKEDAKNDAFIQAEELAERSTGIKRVGYLRMDVDNLGRIFAKGLGEHHNLPRLAALSRQMSYFFKAYLNCLAEERENNLPPAAKKLSEHPRNKLLFIYAGGDDLFISGAWDQIVEFAFDIYQSFRVYVGHHPDITLSGGVSLGTPKYPLYQAANDAKIAEDAAKDNGRDSFTLFGEVFKWSAWLGEEAPQSLIEGKKQKFLRKDDIEYISESPEILPPLIGVFPIANILNEYLNTQYSHSFVRNLLSTAQVQERAIKEAKDNKQSKQHQRDLRYYLHLPKVAYTLARLPQNIRGKPELFSQLKTSLKSPYNAPYFKAIAIWIDLLNRTDPSQNTPSHERKTTHAPQTTSK